MSYKDYKIGQMINVEVVGIQAYGVFTKIDEETQGLIHISEVEHGYVDNLQDLFRIGEKLDVVILDIDEYDGKISLSLRSLKKQNIIHFQIEEKTHDMASKQELVLNP